MTIRIVLPEGGGQKATHGTRVFTSEGSEIENVSRIQMDMLPGNILEARLTVAVESVQNFEGIEGVVVLEPFSRQAEDSRRQSIMNRIRRGHHSAN